MGHRASVAYKHDESTVSAHYSHWGGYDAELLDQISEETPFGSESMEPAFMTELAKVMQDIGSQEGVEVEGRMAEAQDTMPIEVEPRSIVESFDEWAEEEINPLHHECVYFVDTTGDEWEVSALAPTYRREDLDLRKSDETPFVLLDCGADSHAEWGGRQGYDSFEEFVEAMESQYEVRKVVRP